jgi:hypothetical protein
MSYIPPVSQISGSGKPPESSGQIQQIVNEHCRDYPTNIPLGCNVVVMESGKEPALYNGGNIPVNGPINWGSVSKQFTAACIDKLVKQGKIKYEDDIRKLCPDLPEFKLNGVIQKVTVDDLLHMRSGLPEVWGTALMTGQDAEKLENTTLLGLLNKHPGMVFAPGSKFMYCNTNYYVLAKIVDDVSGRQFPDFVREEVLDPLKMQARCSIDPSSQPTIPGYEQDPKDKHWHDVTSTNKTYGTTGLIGSPTDMIAWNDSIARRDYDLLEPPQKINPNESNYCRGVVVDYVDDYRVISHGGALSGANTIYRRYEHRKDPNKTFAIFLTTNADYIPATEATTNKVANAIAGKDLTLPQSQPQALPKRLATQEEVQKFCGKFRCRELGSEWLVKEEDLKGNWGVCMTPPDAGPFPKWNFNPQVKEEQQIFRSDGYGNPTLESTETGFIIHCENIAPLHFDRY